MEYFPDWSSLPIELLETVARCCTVIEDFMAFRGVCTSWRAAAAKNKFVSFSKVPLLMLAEKRGTNEREFYSLAKRKICMRIPLPGAKGKRCNDVGFGWILTKASSGEVCLMKPLSSTRIQLPNFKKFPQYRSHKTNPEANFIRRAWLTANPSETSNFMLLVFGREYLGFWRNGDAKWTNIESIYSPLLTCCNGKVYILDLEGNLLILDPQDLNKSPGLVVPVDNAPTFVSSAWYDYLVGSSDGELLIITRNNTGSGYVDIGANHFKLTKVDVENGECIEISDLGKDAIFLGDNAAFSVDATEFPGVLKPNCIYFTDDCFVSYCNFEECRKKGGGKDMGIYNVKDRSIERFDVESFSRVCPPMWIFPSF